jgi:hypothetical protein
VNVTLLLEELQSTASSVALAVLPLAAFFLVFQLFFLKLPRREVARILTGALVASAGLFLFLLGVGIGFLPFGRAIGEAAAELPAKWMLLPFGMLLGFVTTWGEPSVRILAGQVEEASTGSIRRSLVLLAVCTGVALAVGAGLLRTASGIPLLWLLAPGYGAVIAVMWLSDKSFVAIAVDASGVATGPLANTFLLALGLGASSAMGHRDPLLHGLGLASLIALAPMLVIMALGVLVRSKERRRES